MALLRFVKGQWKRYYEYKRSMALILRPNRQKLYYDYGLAVQLLTHVQYNPATNIS